MTFDDLWWPQYWPERKIDWSSFEMIFDELLNVFSRFPIRFLGAGSDGGRLDAPPGRPWKFRSIGPERVKVLFVTWQTWLSDANAAATLRVGGLNKCRLTCIGCLNRRIVFWHRLLFFRRHKSRTEDRGWAVFIDFWLQFHSQRFSVRIYLIKMCASLYDGNYWGTLRTRPQHHWHIRGPFFIDFLLECLKDLETK